MSYGSGGRHRVPVTPFVQLLVLVLLVLLPLCYGAAVTTRLFNLKPLGSILGTVSYSTWTERPIYQFQGVPYALPPSGDLRFKLPRPAKPWTGVLNATAFQRKCPQANTESELADLQHRIDIGEDVEDCLHLNVYTPQVPGECSRLLPVMFYIHGGSFRVGSAQSFLPNYLLERDVVLVVIQYRLGPLGFLSLQTEDAPGNMGLEDQLLALQWTHTYISLFCGDTEQVTLIGQSSGAAAVTLLMASPLVSPGMFKRAVVQSGSAHCDWAMDFEPVQHAVSIAALANCTNRNLTDLAACLRTRTPWQILMAHSDFLTEVLVTEGRAVRGNNGGNHAVIQTSGKRRFLVEDPKISFQEGRFKKVPMMIGVTKHEGSFFLGNIYDFILERNNITKNTSYLTNDFLKATLQFSGIDDTTGAITDVFQDKYFRSNEVGNFTAMVPGLIDICGVTLLKACTLQQARRNSRVQDTYLYSFNYKGQYTKFGYGEEVHYPFPGGVAHSNDLLYLFPTTDGPLNTADKAVARTMMELWTNFAIHGSPGPAFGVSSWPPMGTSLGPYLRIDKTCTLHDDFFIEYNITASEGLAAYMEEISSLTNVSSSFGTLNGLNYVIYTCLSLGTYIVSTYYCLTLTKEHFVH